MRQWLTGALLASTLGGGLQTQQSTSAAATQQNASSPASAVPQTSPAPGTPASDAVAMAQPLPPVADLLKAVEQHEDRDEALLQQYTYHVHSVMEDFDGSEAVKKTEVVDAESIPINGVRVRKIVARDGKPLSPDEARKESDRFDKEVEKARKIKAKRDEKIEEAKRDDKGNAAFLPASRMLQLGSFQNEHRVLLNGRPTIVLDYTGDREVKSRNPFEDIVEDLVGTVWIDEQDKVLAQVEGHFVNDFKMGMGLIFDIHKGLVFSMQQQKINGEVWLPSRYTGQGKASAILLFRVHGRSQAEMSDYRKFRASATIVGTHGAIDESGKPLEPADTPGGAPNPPK